MNGYDSLDVFVFYWCIMAWWMDISVEALHNALCIMYHMVITESWKICQIWE
jgi:hypothetical protein